MAETFGTLIDKLSITNIKLYHEEDVNREPTSTDTEIASSTRRIHILNSQRNELIQEIDELFYDVLHGKKEFKPVKIMKKYHNESPKGV